MRRGGCMNEKEAASAADFHPAQINPPGFICFKWLNQSSTCGSICSGTRVWIHRQEFKSVPRTPRSEALRHWEVKLQQCQRRNLTSEQLQGPHRPAESWFFTSSSGSYKYVCVWSCWCSWLQLWHLDVNNALEASFKIKCGVFPDLQLVSHRSNWTQTGPSGVIILSKPGWWLGLPPSCVYVLFTRGSLISYSSVAGKTCVSAGLLHACAKCKYAIYMFRAWIFS